MPKFLLKGAIGVIAGVLLFWWPLVLPDTAGRWLAAKLSLNAIFSLWATSAVCGVLLILSLIVSHLRRYGRAALPGQPALGLAGKPWGALAPSLWLPGSLAVSFAGIIVGWVHGFNGVFFVPALLVCMVIAFVYVRVLYLASRRRDLLMQRRNTDSGSICVDTLTLKADSQQVLHTIATLLGVDKEKLRWSDRLGTDIGSFSTLDETLDRLGRILLKEQHRAGRPLVLENIKTMGDYVTEWLCCNPPTTPK